MNKFFYDDQDMNECASRSFWWGSAFGFIIGCLITSGGWYWHGLG